MSTTFGTPDGQEITQWLGQKIAEQTALAIGAGTQDFGPFALANFASVVVAIKPTGGQVTVKVKQTIAGGPAALELDEQTVVPAGATAFIATVLFADQVTIELVGGGVGTTVDFAVYPSNTTTNAQVITQATINVQHNDVLIAAEPTLDFEDGEGNLWTITDDAANTRVKIALLAGLPSVLVTESAAQTWGNNGGGTGTFQPHPFDTESWDTDNFHDPAVNPTRLTAPAGLGGKYLVFAWIQWAPNAGGFRQIDLKKNGSFLGPISTLPGTVTGGEQDMQVVGFVSLAAGEYVEVGVYQNSGGNLTTSAGATFGMVRIGS